MRKSLARLAALAALILSVGTGIQSAGALPVADLSSTTVGSPDSVSPVGGVVYYTVEFANVGATVPAQLRNKTTGGGTFVKKLSSIPLTCSAPADGAQNPEVVCDSLAFAGSMSLEVAIRTVDGTMTSTSTASIDPAAVGSVVEDDTSNNNSLDTTRVWNNPNISQALLGHLESLRYKTHLVTNRTGTNGIVTYLSDAPPAGAACGNVYCGTGLRLDFGKEANRQGILTVVARFQTDPCRGLGAGKCFTIYERKDGEVNAVPACGPLVPPTTTCLEGMAKEGRAFVHTFKMTSTDPDLLPPGTLTLN
jgi:hypothetical protein